MPQLTHGRARLLASFLLAGLLPLPVQAASVFRADLDAAQSVSPGGSSGSTTTGTASVALTATALSFDVEIGPGLDFGPVSGGSAGSGDEVIGFHLHTGDRATAFGPIVFGIFAPDSDTDGDTVVDIAPDGSTRIRGEWDLAEGNAGSTLADFLAGLSAATAGDDTALYFNIHTVADGAGAIRGHVVAVPEPGIALQLWTGLTALGLLQGHRRPVRRR